MFSTEACEICRTLCAPLRVDVPTDVGVGLIGFGGRLFCEGYEVQTDGRHSQAPAAAPVYRRVQSERRSPGGLRTCQWWRRRV